MARWKRIVAKSLMPKFGANRSTLSGWKLRKNKGPSDHITRPAERLIIATSASGCRGYIGRASDCSACSERFESGWGQSRFSIFPRQTFYNFQLFMKEIIILWRLTIGLMFSSDGWQLCTFLKQAFDALYSRRPITVCQCVYAWRTKLTDNLPAHRFIIGL